jgi:hypothetical protein
VSGINQTEASDRRGGQSAKLRENGGDAISKAGSEIRRRCGGDGKLSKPFTRPGCVATPSKADELVAPAKEGSRRSPRIHAERARPEIVAFEHFKSRLECSDPYHLGAARTAQAYGRLKAIDESHRAYDGLA